MATRLYLSGASVPDISPAFSATGLWNATAGAVRRKMDTAKDASAMASLATSGATAGTETEYLTVQFTSRPLAAQTIAGTIKGQVRGFEDNALANAAVAMGIYLRTPAGVAKATFGEPAGASLTSEFTVTPTFTNRKAPRANLSPLTIASQTAAHGDLLVIELGWSKYENAATSRTVTYSVGSSAGTDLAEDETTTTANDPWFEFSADIVFLATAVPDLAMARRY